MAEANIFTRTVLIVIGILSICLAVFTGFNIYYYTQMKTDDTAGAVISSGTSSGMIVVNSLLCFVFTVITFWSIYRLIYSTDAGKKALGAGIEGLKQAIQNIKKTPTFDKSRLVNLTKEEEKLALENAKNEKLKQDAEDQMIKEMNDLAKEAAAIKRKIEEKNDDLKKRIDNLQGSANNANEKFGKMPIKYERKEDKPEIVKSLECQLETVKKELKAKEEELNKFTCQKQQNQNMGGGCPRPPQNSLGTNNQSSGIVTISGELKKQYIDILRKLSKDASKKLKGDDRTKFRQIKDDLNKAVHEKTTKEILANAVLAQQLYDNEIKLKVEGSPSKGGSKNGAVTLFGEKN